MARFLSCKRPAGYLLTQSNIKQGRCQGFNRTGAKHFHGEIYAPPTSQNLLLSKHSRQIFIFFAIFLDKNIHSKDNYVSGRVQCTGWHPLVNTDECKCNRCTFWRRPWGSNRTRRALQIFCKLETKRNFCNRNLTILVLYHWFPDINL